MSSNNHDIASIRAGQTRLIEFLQACPVPVIHGSEADPNQLRSLATWLMDYASKADPLILAIGEHADCRVHDHLPGGEKDRQGKMDHVVMFRDITRGGIEGNATWVLDSAADDIERERFRGLSVPRRLSL